MFKLKLIFLTNLVYIVFKLLSLTYRIRFLNRQILENAKLQHPNKSYIIGLWHQNIFAALSAEKNTHLVLVSPSKDGEFVAVTCQKLGHKAVRGSSNKRSHESLREMVRFMNEGYPAAITIDGPRGPLYDVKAGIIEISRQTQTMIVPMAPIAQHYWSIRSWDRFRIPKPFSKIAILYGTPFLIPGNAQGEIFDQYKDFIKKSLLDLELQIGEKFKKGLI